MATLENPVSLLEQTITDRIQGLVVKDAVRAATDGTNVDLSSAVDPNPIDGVSLSNGDRVLLKDQTDSTENGIYDAVTATDPTTWIRSSDFDQNDEVVAGAFVFVEEGTNNSDTGWVVSSNDPLTLGSDAINWSQFTGGGTVTAGDGLSKTSNTLNIDVSDFAGTGIEDDGSENLRIASAAAGDGLQGGSGSALAVDVSDFAGSGIQDDGTENLELVNDSVTITAGDGLQTGGSVALGGSVTLDVDVSDFAGSGLQDSGTEDLELVNDSVTITAGDGLSTTGDGTLALGDTETFSVNASDIAGTFLGTSGAPANLDVQVGNGLENDGGGNIRVNPDGFAGDGLQETSATTLGVDVSQFAGAGLQDDGAENLELVNNSVTVTAGDGLKNGGSVALGGSTTLDIEPADFAGSGLQDDGADNLELVNNSVTVTAGDGLKGGGSIALGGSTTLNIEPANFAGTFTSDDGADNLTVDIGNGLENDGAGNIRVNPGAIAGEGLEEESTTLLGINEAANLTWAGRQEFDEFVTRNGTGQYPISVTHTSWADGLTNEEIFRLDLEAGEVMEVWRVECSQKGGGTSANFDVDVFDNGTSTELASATLGSVSAGGTTPLGTSGAGNVILVRLSNSTGGAISASINIITYIVPSSGT